MYSATTDLQVRLDAFTAGADDFMVKPFDPRELKARIAKTLDFIAGVKAAQIDGTEDRDLVIKLGAREVQWKGMQYLLGFALPNFYFHATTAYAILRRCGVPIGKRDFLGEV